ncbi:hypothetical protein KBZ16_17440 [Vulcanococcus limneticus Candia 3B3]|uniref:SxtJ family membrane protein n=1 Tax=Vulcanococcus limneticus TaxID=2170428 RepID=UPI0020CD0373|nr:SxtJ family membrane protein [Vulcanococcus limneticus]MCP9899003.1 hypothetical protein [Vulcanococcus limneticus Candia 3B3]
MTDSPSKKQLKEFGYLIGFGFPILIGWLLPTLFGHGFRAWTLWVGIPGLILGLIAPGLLRQPYRAWMALGHALGWVNSHVILGLVFIVVLQPIAYVMRLFGHDPLRRKKNHGNQSYREERKTLEVDFNRIF